MAQYAYLNPWRLWQVCVEAYLDALEIALKPLLAYTWPGRETPPVDVSSVINGAEETQEATKDNGAADGHFIGGVEWAEQPETSLSIVAPIPTALEIRAPADGYLRGGLEWTVAPITVSIRDLTEAQLDAITNDPELSVNIVHED
jgi:hypothetical protein